MNGLEKKERHGQLVAIALKLAERSSYIQVKREDVAAAADVATSTVNYVIGGASALREAIVAEAVRTENATVVAQALGMRHPLAVDASDVLKARAVQLIGEL